MDQDRVILLVEDDPNDEELTLQALRKHHVRNEVVIKRDGAEALDFLFGQASGQLPQIILLDLKLPKIEGLEVLRRLRSHESTRLLPVVIFTSSNQDEDRINGYRLGANSFVRKPVDFQQFSAAVQQLGLYWLGLNEPPPSLP
jgi:two-component system response regulator